MKANMTGMDWRWNLRQGAWRQTYLDGLLDILYIDTPPFIAEYVFSGTYGPAARSAQRADCSAV
jgi:hypothetical protein